MALIRNVIFDMGNVMIHFTPERYVARIGLNNPEDEALLMKVTYRSVEWTLLDWGSMDEQELEVVALKKLPERLHAAARELIHHWNDPIEPVSGMAELARDCKRAGLGVYLLSNASRRLLDYWKRIPGHEYFDGMVVSAPLRMVKPLPEIYRHLLEKYDLKAEECLFIDDAPLNVSGAMQVGMRAILFDGDAETARRAIFG